MSTAKARTADVTRARADRSCLNIDIRFTAKNTATSTAISHTASTCRENRRADTKIAVRTRTRRSAASTALGVVPAASAGSEPMSSFPVLPARREPEITARRRSDKYRSVDEAG